MCFREVPSTFTLNKQVLFKLAFQISKKMWHNFCNRDVFKDVLLMKQVIQEYFIVLKHSKLTEITSLQSDLQDSM